MSQVAASNFPAGSDSPANLDDVQRAQASFIALLRDGKGLSAPVTLASAATTDIGGQNSPFVEISGTTGITSLGTNYNGPRFLRFTGALLLTHSSSMSLTGAANITTAAGDTCVAYPNSAGNGWTVVSYQRGAALAASSGANSDITSLSGFAAVTVQIFTGSGTYTRPPGMRNAIIQLQAPGGGGGGAVASSSNLAVGSGGGGGGYAERLVTAAQIGASQTVTMGSVGAAGDTAGSSGGAGGTTSFGSLLSATGGAGGASISGGTSPSRGSNPGAGGIGSLGDTNIRGSAGQFGARFSGTNGYSGNGGSSHLGGGAAGATEGGSGNAGGNYGGGGSGGNSDSATGRGGGAGGPGVIVVYEFY